MANQPPKPRVADCPDVREIYSDKLVGASFAGGSIVLTLGCNRFGVQQAPDQPAGEGTIVVNNRVALSPQLAIDLVNALTQIINAAQQQQAQQQQAQQQQALAQQPQAAAKTATITPDPGQTKPQ